jgi:hypothetical protein
MCPVLSGCIPARIRHALADLSETLDETYERTLREINKANWGFAHRLFQFVAVAVRPLYVEELAELLAYDFKAGPIPKFHRGLAPGGSNARGSVYLPQFPCRRR